MIPTERRAPLSCDNVVILADRDDGHAPMIGAAVATRAIRCDIVDPAAIGALTMAAHDGALTINGISVSKRTTVWWRRVRAPRPPVAVSDAEARRFVAAEWRAALYGSLQASGCRLVNDPLFEESANRKPLQLRVAREAGLRIPETLVINDAEAARGFVAALAARGSRCIYKASTGSPRYMVDTREIAERDIVDTELALAPVIFQERIELGHDLRIAIIGRQAFASRIRSRFDDILDWRLDPLVRYDRTTIAAELEDRLFAVLHRLGLATGSFDVRVDPHGEPVFFEVNPSGQFVFLEAEPGYPVTAAFVDLLIGDA